MENILQFFKSGGIILGIILVFTFFALFLIIDRFLYLKKFDCLTEAINDISDILFEYNLPDAKLYIQQCNSEIAGLFRTGVDCFDQPEGILQNHLKQSIYGQIKNIQKHLTLIHVIANLMPMTGLLGTVAGLIEIFRAMQINGSGAIGYLSGGMSKVLIATEAGIFSCLVLSFCHAILSNKSKLILLELNRAATSIVNISSLKHRSKSRGIIDSESEENNDSLNITQGKKAIAEKNK